MKAKNIFKTLAFAMLMSAMSLTTACINDEIPNEIPNENGYALPVTVNVTCQSDDPATRASYNDGTRKLSFSEEDRLFIKGSHNVYEGAGPFAGTLDYVPATGKFSGTILARVSIQVLPTNFSLQPPKSKPPCCLLATKATNS